MIPVIVGDVLLKAEGVSLSLGGNPVLRGVDLEIRDLIRPGKVTGQVVGLLGPSGIGKTQLCRILAGLQTPSSGTVRIGKAQELVAAGKVGLVSQTSSLFAHRTVLGNLLVAARQGGLRGGEARAKATAFLERFGLAGYGRRYPAELSGGERQRVAIAQQFLCSEHFLLLDEPFSGLDPVATDVVCKVIAEASAMHELNTLIIVTHDGAAAAAISDTLWLLGRDRGSDGRPVPGARIQQRYDLVARGLAWRSDLHAAPEFGDLVREVRLRFKTL
ncbi:MAG: ABC transporter ATP-binding protein [Deltaproteobacteria bacterium]|nr:ABC transporter ATP-binding protein [Deltaproteobacteria bacterium]